MNYLNIPGLYNSGSEHWQTRWEELYPSRFARVNQDDWELPFKNSWVEKLNDHIAQLSSPTILVAHSLGCITVAHWTSEYSSPFVKGALLVAPADVEGTSKEHFNTFAPVPLNCFSFPSTVIASTTDPYAAIHRSARWAAYWGSRFVCVGDRGHINSSSNLNEWEEGLSFLNSLKERIGSVPEYKYAI